MVYLLIGLIILFIWAIAFHILAMRKVSEIYEYKLLAAKYEVDKAKKLEVIVERALPMIEKTMDSFYGKPIYEQRAHEVERNHQIDLLRAAWDVYRNTETPWVYVDSPELFDKIEEYQPK